MARRRSLRGAVVVITGATSGVGRACAHAFAAHGCRLVVAARSGPALREVAAECEGRGAEVLAVSLDIADAEAFERLERGAVSRFGRIDVWVEAAAVVIASLPGEEPPDELRRLVDTNVLGTLLGSRIALRRFQAQGSGVLINLASMLGVVPNPLVPAYVMSKFAVRGLSLSLRQAVSGHRDIHVCVVLPGPIDTPLFERAANHTGRQLRAIPPACAPERVAATVVSCARRPRRQATAAVVPRLALLAHRIAPRPVEWAIAVYAAATITKPVDAPPTSGSLFDPPPTGRVHGGWRRGRLRRRLGEAWGTWLAERGAHPAAAGDAAATTHTGVGDLRGDGDRRAATGAAAGGAADR